MGHARASAGRWVVVFTVLLALLLTAAPAFSMPRYATPVLQEVGVIRTTPIAGTSLAAGDLEGMAYVPSDDALWLTDDKRNRVYELDRSSGGLRSMVEQAELAATRILGGTTPAGLDRTLDVEAAAYDEPGDVLYLFAGPCCKDHVRPAVYRLLRDGSGRFRPESWQPLTSPMDDFSGATTDPTGQLWVSLGRDLYRYDYETNTFGSGFRVPGQRGNIRGLGLSPDGSDLWIAAGGSLLYRVDWATRQIVPGHEFDLTGYGIPDARAAEVIGDRLYVADGYDLWPSGSPDAYTVRIFEILDSGGGSGVAPVAGFTTSATGGPAPLAVSFTDTSANAPTSWSWDLGDGTTSSTQHPTHTYTAAGTYTVTMTATNAHGSSTATATVEVTQPAAATSTFTATDDAYVVSSKLNGTNGTNAFMRLGGGDTEYRPYVGFTVDGVQGPVVGAVLRVLVTVGSDQGGRWHRVGDGWTETTLTWGNAPALSGSPITTLGRVDAGQWIEIDVTDMVDGNGRYSFAASSTSTNNARFATREAGSPAELVVTTVGS